MRIATKYTFRLRRPSADRKYSADLGPQADPSTIRTYLEDNNVGLTAKASEEIRRKTTEACRFRQLHSFDALPREYPHKPYNARN